MSPKLKNKNPVIALKEKMESLSERCWNATWMVNTGFALWDILQEDKPTKWGQGFITKEDIEELKKLHELAGGWWVWIETDRIQMYDIPVEISFSNVIFLLTEDWLDFYNGLKVKK